MSELGYHLGFGKAKGQRADEITKSEQRKDMVQYYVIISGLDSSSLNSVLYLIPHYSNLCHGDSEQPSFLTTERAQESVTAARS